MYSLYPYLTYWIDKHKKHLFYTIKARRAIIKRNCIHKQTFQVIPRPHPHTHPTTPPLYQLSNLSINNLSILISRLYNPPLGGNDPVIIDLYTKENNGTPHWTKRNALFSTLRYCMLSPETDRLSVEFAWPGPDSSFRLCGGLRIIRHYWFPFRWLRCRFHITKPSLNFRLEAWPNKVIVAVLYDWITQRRFIYHHWVLTAVIQWSVLNILMHGCLFYHIKKAKRQTYCFTDRQIQIAGFRCRPLKLSTHTLNHDCNSNHNRQLVEYGISCLQFYVPMQSRSPPAAKFIDCTHQVGFPCAVFSTLLLRLEFLAAIRSGGMTSRDKRRSAGNTAGVVGQQPGGRRSCRQPPSTPQPPTRDRCPVDGLSLITFRTQGPHLLVICSALERARNPLRRDRLPAITAKNPFPGASRRNAVTQHGKGSIMWRCVWREITNEGSASIPS